MFPAPLPPPDTVSISDGVLASRADELRASLAEFRLFNPRIQWPDVINKFSVILGQTHNFADQFSKVPSPHELAIAPLLFSQQREPELEAASQGRLAAFKPDAVADVLLRTRPAPEVEQFVSLLRQEAERLRNEIRLHLGHIDESGAPVLGEDDPDESREEQRRQEESFVSGLVDTHNSLAEECVYIVDRLKSGGALTSSMNEVDQPFRQSTSTGAGQNAARPAAPATMTDAAIIKFAMDRQIPTTTGLLAATLYGSRLK